MKKKTVIFGLNDQITALKEGKSNRVLITILKYKC